MAKLWVKFSAYNWVLIFWQISTEFCTVDQKNINYRACLFSNFDFFWTALVGNGRATTWAINASGLKIPPKSWLLSHRRLSLCDLPQLYIIMKADQFELCLFWSIIFAKNSESLLFKPRNWSNFTWIATNRIS